MQHQLQKSKQPLPTGKTTLIAGGTDLLGTLKDNILRDYPSTVVNIKTVPGLDYIKEEKGILKIGATTRLADIAADPTVQKKYTALAQAASACSFTPYPGHGYHSWKYCTASQVLGIFANRKTCFDCHTKGRINMLCHER